MSAGFTEAFSGAIGKVDAQNAGFSPARVVAAAVVGGTGSAIGGGKFANGAVTGAFVQAFNHESDTHSGDDAIDPEGVKKLGTEIREDAEARLGPVEHRLSVADPLTDVQRERILGVEHDLRRIQTIGASWESQGIASDYGTISFQMRPTNGRGALNFFRKLVTPFASHNQRMTHSISCSYGAGSCSLSVTTKSGHVHNIYQ